MSMPIWIFFLTEAVIVIKCAPKLGHVLFDPLSYEAEKIEQVKALLKQIISVTQQQKATTLEEITIQPVTETVNTKPSVYVTSLTQNITIPDGNFDNQPKKLADVFKILENKGFRRQRSPLKSSRADEVTKAEPKEPCVEYDYNRKLCKVINNRLLCGYDKNKGKLKQDHVVYMGNNCRARNGRIECGYEKGQWNESLRRPPARDETPNANEALSSIPEDASVPKLRIQENSSSKEIITILSISSKETSDTANKIVTTARVTDYITTEVVNDSTPKSMTTTEPTTAYNTPELFTATQQTTENIPEITATQQITYHLQPEGNNKETTNITTFFAPELKSTTPTENTRDLVTSTIQVTLNADVQGTAKVKREVFLSPDRFASMSIAEVNKPKTRRDTNKKPKKYCVEKGDRIVCYYTKNY